MSPGVFHGAPARQLCLEGTRTRKMTFSDRVLRNLPPTADILSHGNRLCLTLLLSPDENVAIRRLVRCPVLPVTAREESCLLIWPQAGRRPLTLGTDSTKTPLQVVQVVCRCAKPQPHIRRNSASSSSLFGYSRAGVSGLSTTAAGRAPVPSQKASPHKFFEC